MGPEKLRVPFLYKMKMKREGTGFPIPSQKVLIYAVLISRSSASAGPRKPCRGGPRREPSRARCRGWRPGCTAWPAWPARTCPAVAPFSASTRISRFFLVESVTTSPSSSANLAACSASSRAALLPVLADLGIALAIGHAGHGQIHADLGALAGEVGVQAVDDLLLDLSGNIRAKGLAHAHNVLGSPAQLALLLGELGAGNTALGALLGGILALIHITANRANPLLHMQMSSFYTYLFLKAFFHQSPWDSLSITGYSNILKLLLQLLENFSEFYLRNFRQASASYAIRPGRYSPPGLSDIFLQGRITSPPPPGGPSPRRWPSPGLPAGSPRSGQSGR